MYKIVKKLITLKGNESKSTESVEPNEPVRSAEPVAVENEPNDKAHDVRTYVPLGHYHSPIPSTEYIRKNHQRIFAPLPKSIPGIDLREKHQLELVRNFKQYYDTQPFQAAKTYPLRYFFENPSYSYLDGIFLHSMIRHFKPARIIEVGSGYTTCLILDTKEMFLEGQLELTCIEPYPDLLASLLRQDDLQTIQLLAKDLQEVDVAVFSSLQKNDILLIDSTHVARVGSDVNFAFFEMLPRLTSGVLIHFHDVFYPFEYPMDWIYENRGWSELYVLRAFLQFNSDFEITLFSSYLMNFHQDLISALMPLSLKNAGGNIWLRRK